MGWAGTRPAAPGTSGFHFLVSMLLLSGAVVGVELVYVHPRPGDGVAGHTYTVSARATPVRAPGLSALRPSSPRTGLVLYAPAARCRAALPSPRRALHPCGRLSPRKVGAAMSASVSQGVDQTAARRRPGAWTERWNSGRQAGRAPDSPPPSGLFLLPPQTSRPSKAAGFPWHSREENLLFAQK